MRNAIVDIVNNMNMYYGDAVFLMLAAMSYLYLFVYGKEQRGRFLYPILLILFCIVNPLLYILIFYKINLWQMCWMLPNALIIALAVTRLIKCSEKKREKAVVLLCMAGVLLLKGNNVYQSGNYTWIQNWEKITETWTVTQYASVTGAQQMFYTIEDMQGRLVIVDGGYDVDAEQVQNVIAAHDNHVEAWIITHPHPDHVGAFNVIAASPDGIVVDHLYSVQVNYERYQETAQEYDGFEACETYFQVLENLEKTTEVHYVQENDEFEMIGLKVKVLHGWDEEVDSLPDHLCNNGSMLFVVSGHLDKMLFCGDVQKEVERGIIERHKHELDVDYVQTGHHGNWGMTTDFYQYMTPKGVFFDSTDALLEPGEIGYDAGELKAYFETQGAIFYNFSTAPNQIILQ